MSRGTVALVFYSRMRSYPRIEVLSIFVENSNFYQLRNPQAQENSEIIECLRKRDEKYTSPEIQNELLEAMALGMVRQISANIQNARFSRSWLTKQPMFLTRNN